MSFLARLSLAHRGLIALITLVVVAFGAYITPAPQRQLLSSPSFPQVPVAAAYPGAAPQIVEDRGVDRGTVPLEEGAKLTLPAGVGYSITACCSSPAPRPGRRR
ncbi:hypothetical protein AB0J35_54260 [Nonomuraea angiospora]|uniref:hypothetical protein n=1 Tax=Nonomuraea angiospora TaxID=46172 RepID=UPI0034168B39